MSSNRPADQDELELTDAMTELSCEGDDNLPEEWRDDPENPGLALERYFDSLPRYQKEWKQQGLSTFEVIKDTRANPTTQTYKLTTDEWITVPEEEIPKLEEQGWKVYCPPFPAIDPEKGNQDKRPPAPPPADVITTDNPVADGNHYLRDGFEMVKRMSENKWKPGDLLDEDGSDPKVKDGLASYASPSDRDQITDLRSATSTSHLFHHERPDDVCVGWGGYDEFSHWQSCGLRVAKDIVGIENPKAAEDPEAKERVEERKWENDNNGATEFVNEAGEAVFTMPAYVTHPLQRGGRQTTGKAKPRSLYSRLHPHKTDKTAKKPQDPKELKEPTKVWWW
ncbi:unnamed protein product [Clonostachys rhizophaga]|uniref:Uncharacterized protein n=1 Tax=Clonostachys rhizophaga TaxID=160324 RepID=A0A9N9VTU2_9HYPO|nr:unnamed protein product [Clonostachys rhizophaga]